MSHTTALAYCQDKCCPPDSALHYATIFLPTADRLFWIGLFALHQELRTASLKQLDNGLTQVKLGWWNNALRGTLNNGNPHPVIKALGEIFLAEFGSEFWAMTIEKVVQSCDPTRHNTLTDWEHALKEELTPWLTMISKRYNLNTSQTQNLLGFWIQSSKLAQLLAIAKHLDGHFQPIPINQLEQHGITAQALQAREHNPQTQALFAGICQETTHKANTAWQHCCPYTRRVGRPLRALFRIKVQESKQHKGRWMLLREQYRISPLRKFWLGWLCYGLRG